jgi:hypothetical protein
MNNKDKFEIVEKIKEELNRECKVAEKYVKMSNRLLSVNEYAEITFSNKDYSDLSSYLSPSTKKIIKEIIINDLEKQLNEYLLKEGFLK